MAWPLVAIAIALRDAPHRSLFTKRFSALVLKNIDFSPDWLRVECAGLIAATVTGGPKSVKQMVEQSLAL